MTPSQIVQVISMPIGKTLEKLDACVLIEREKIRMEYLKLLADSHSHSEAALTARANWMNDFLNTCMVCV